MDDATALRQLGARLRRVSLLLIVVSPLAGIALLVWKGPLALLTVPHTIELYDKPVGAVAAAALIAVGCMRPLVFFAALLLLHRLFGLFAKGVVFAPEAVLLIRRLGVLLIATDFVAMLQGAATGPLLTLFGFAPRHMAVPMQASMLIVGLFVVLIGHVMRMACEINERDRLTI